MSINKVCISIEDKKCIDKIGKETLHFINNKEELVFLCIGTDRSSGDSLGPFVGHYLTKSKCPFPVYGTLENPIHAKNLFDTIEEINKKYPRANIIAIDACLGSANSVGSVIIDRKAISPGKALNKNLPSVGDLSIVGVVNLSGSLDFIVLQNTRMYLVNNLAEAIAKGIMKAVRKKSKNAKVKKAA